MSEDISVSSILNDYAKSSANTVRTSASVSVAEEKLKVEFSASFQDNDKAIESKSDNQILTELKTNGSSSSVTAQQLSEKYDISIDRAMLIIDKLKNDVEQIEYEVSSGISNSYTYIMNTHPNENYTTVSYSI